MIPPLVSFDLAKKHLRQLSDDLDVEIDSKLRLASGIAVNFCKLTAIPNEWFVDPDTEVDYESTDLILDVDADSSPPGLTKINVPGNIQSAILLMLGDLFYNTEASAGNVLSQTVIDLLTPFRDPTIA